MDIIVDVMASILIIQVMGGMFFGHYLVESGWMSVAGWMASVLIVFVSTLIMALVAEGRGWDANQRKKKI